MAEKIEIDVIARDLISNPIGFIKDKLMSLGGTAGMVAGAAVTLGAAIAGAMKMAVDKAQEYDQQIKGLMLTTGATAEETARMIQTIDDAGVEFGTLKTALKEMSKEGVAPTIDGLADIADEYKKLAPGVERNNYLMKNFGRSGIDMARAMDLGGDGIRKLAAEVDDALIPTEKSIDASEEYRQNVDELHDSWEGFWISLGNKVIPVLNKTIANEKETAEITHELTQKTKYLSVAELAAAVDIEKKRRAAIRARDALEAIKDETLEYAGANTTAIETLEEFEARMKSVTDENKNFLSTLTNIQDEEERYTETARELGEERANIAAWDIAALDENTRKTKENEKEHEKANKKIMIGLVERKLLQDGILDDKELDFYLKLGVAWEIWGQTVVDETERALRKVDLLTLGVGRAIAMAYTTSEEFRLNAEKRGRGYTQYGSEEYSSPSGGVGYSSPSGGAVINLNITTPALIGSDAAARDALLPILRDGVRQLQAEGALAR